MAEFTEIAKIKARMCDKCVPKCTTNGCPLSTTLNGKNMVCSQLFEDYPEEYERLCLEWAKENPEITNKDKLYQIIEETFGAEIANAIITRPARCGCWLLNDNENRKCGYFSCDDCSDKGFWNKPYVKPKEGE